MVNPVARKRLPVPERRAVIIEAAGRMFGERGYDATRLDEIATAAGVTKPILYRHFGSKHGLYLALLERHREDLAGFAAMVPATGAPAERVRAVLEPWVDYVEAHAYAWKMIFRDSGGGEEIRAFRVEVNARARTVLAGVIAVLAEREIPPAEIEPTAELMSMGMASLVLWWLENPEVARDAIIGAMTRIWVGILSGGGSASL
jgi:AcrR family transcriptional regulator